MARSFIYSLALSALPLLTAATNITFMLPFDGDPTISAAISTVTDSTTVYALQCSKQDGESNLCQNGDEYRYTILDQSHFNYDKSNSASLVSVVSSTRYTVYYSNSATAFCTVTSDGAFCSETSTRTTSTGGGAAVTSSTSDEGYAMFEEFVVDVPASGTGVGHVTALSTPFLGSTTGPGGSGGPSPSTSGSTGASGTNATATTSSKTAGGTNAAGRNAAGALVVAGGLLIALL